MTKPVLCSADYKAMNRAQRSGSRNAVHLAIRASCGKCRDAITAYMAETIPIRQMMDLEFSANGLCESDHENPKGPADAHWHCFTCSTDDPPKDGADTCENALARLDEQQACLVECEYSLVHCTGPKYVFDSEGLPVVCAECVKKALLQHNPKCMQCQVCGEEHVR